MPLHDYKAPLSTIQCRKHCDSYPRCLGFEYVKASRKCFFKATFNPTSNDPAIDMHEKRCFSGASDPTQNAAMPPMKSPEGFSIQYSSILLHSDSIPDNCIFFIDKNRFCSDWASKGALF